MCWLKSHNDIIDPFPLAYRDLTSYTVGRHPKVQGYQWMGWNHKPAVGICNWERISADDVVTFFVGLMWVNKHGKK